MFINLLSGVLLGKMYFAVETERNRLPRTSSIIYMALIGAEILLAQQFEPLVFISGVLNPWLIGFAVVSVIYAASNYSLHGPSWAPAAFDRGGEPKDLNPCKAGVGRSILACWDISSLVQNIGKAGAEWKFGLKKDFICSKVGAVSTVLNGILQRTELDPLNPGEGGEAERVWLIT